MGIFSKLTTFYLSNRIKSINYSKGNASKDQASLLTNLLNIGKNTNYGIKYNFRDAKDYNTFKDLVPVVEYEDLIQHIPFVDDTYSDKTIWQFFYGEEIIQNKYSKDEDAKVKDFISNSMHFFARYILED